MTEVWVFKILDRNTWKLVSGELRGERIVTPEGELPAKGLKKIIWEEKGFFRRKIKHVFAAIFKSNSEVVDVNEDGNWSVLEEPSIIEEAIAKGLSRLAQPPSIWWQWLMLILVGILGGIGLGIMIAYIVKPPIVVVAPSASAPIPKPPIG